MKRILFTMCALVAILTGCVPVYAAAESRSFYPVSVEEHLEGDLDEYRILKVYQLSLSDDPSLIPVEDFERQGCIWRLLDMTRRDDIGVDTRPHTETVTKPSDTDRLESILQALDAEIEVTTEDGYAGTLRLDHTTVQVSADGYATKTRSLSATRTYPNLSDADVSLIPKTITDGGHTLELQDVQWAEAYQTEAEGAVLRYSATASYTGSTSSRYATGYTVTADYSGDVAKTGCDVVTYTAIFGVVGAVEADEPAPTPESIPETEPDPEPEQQDEAESKKKGKPAVIAAAAIALGGGGYVAYKKIRERR